MAVSWKTRRDDGALTSDDLDDNADNFGNAITALQALAAEGVVISSMTQSIDGTQITFNMSNGATFGPYTMMSGQWRPMGEWATGLHYSARDFVSRLGGSYFAVTAHDAGVFDDDLAAGKWQLVAESPTKAIVFYATFQATAVAAGAGPTVYGGFLVTRPCKFRGTDELIRAALLSAPGAGKSLIIGITRIQPDGTVTVIDAATFGATDKAKTMTDVQAFDVGDVIEVGTTSVTSGTGAAAGLLVTLPLEATD